MTVSEFSDLIRVTDYQVLGKLPDPFRKEDGTRIKKQADWGEQRKFLYKSAVELQYGTQPPDPEVFRVEPCYITEKQHSYRITAGTEEKQLSFYTKLFTPKKRAPWPTAVDGDLCFMYAFDRRGMKPLPRTDSRSRCSTVRRSCTIFTAKTA